MTTRILRLTPIIFINMLLVLLFVSSGLTAPLSAFNCRQGPSQPLSSSDRDGFIQQNSLPRPSAPTIYIPSLKGVVTQLKIFEGGQGGVADDQRNYQNSFSSSSSRFIYWELNLSHPAPGRRLEFAIDEVWYGPDGSEFARNTTSSHILDTWSTSNHYSSWGWNEPGKWKPGTYRVDIVVGGKKITSGSFVITGAGGETVITSAYQIPSLRGRVTSIDFYEEGLDAVPKEQRQYSSQFSRSSARAIWWELNLDYADPGRKLDFAIDAVYIGPDGSVLSRQTHNSTIHAGWTTSYHSRGWGWKEPGKWEAGTYRIELSINGKRVASGTYQIKKNEKQN